MDFVIRSARPEDASLLAWVQLMAGRSHLQRGIWDIIISQPEDVCLDFLRLLTVTRQPHMCHYTSFLVAESDGRAVAALAGYDPVKNGELKVSEAMPEVMATMGLTDDDMSRGQQGLTAFMTCHHDAYEGAWVVESVATLPEHRRRGLIDSLLEATVEEGQRRGFRRAQVSFYIGNTPAQQAYEKAGFRYFDEKRHPDFEREIGCPGMVRLLRDLKT